MSANSKQVGGNHYIGRKIQHWDYACQLPYLEGLATKYIDRHREKGGKQDLLKAIHTIEKMIEEYYPSVSTEEVEILIHDVFGDPPCSHTGSGEHRWSHVYKHGKDGRLQEVMICDLCRLERGKG